MTAAAKKIAPKKRPKTYLLEVSRGCFKPADGYTERLLREKGYSIGDKVLATLKKPRNPGFHRFAHRMGDLIAQNIEAFHGLDAHETLKRIQIEANIACQEIPVVIPVMGEIRYRVPESLSFENMDETEFRAVIRQMATYIAKTYWPDCEPEEIERMAMVMPEAA